MFVENGKVRVNKFDIATQIANNKLSQQRALGDEFIGGVNFVETSKWVVKGGGDWELIIDLSLSKDFPTREEYDRWATRKWRNHRDVQADLIETIEIEHALRKLSSSLSIDINMDYYSNRLDELANELGRQIDIDYLEYLVESKDKQLEREIFHKQMCILMGDDSPPTTTANELDDSEFDFMVKEFRLLINNGNDFIATAKRGHYYVRFKYCTS